MNTGILSLVFLTFGLTLWASQFLLQRVGVRAFLDKPNTRKIHAVATPRYGGIGFVTIYLMCGIFLTGSFDIPLNWYWLGAFVLLVLGSIDDARILSWRVKLLVQISLAAGIWMSVGHTMTQLTFFEIPIQMPAPFMGVLFLFWFLGMLNAVNLIDGMDGLAGGTSLILSFGAALLGAATGRPLFFLLNLLLVGVLIGFLHFNSRPARFFMGDGGSLFLGFHMAVLPILYYVTRPGSGHHAVEITPMIILSTYLIMDTLRVFFVRILHRKHPMEPDNQHLHHGLLEKTLSYNGTLLIIFGMNALAVLLALFQEAFQLTLVTMWVYLLLVALKILFPPLKEGLIHSASVLLGTIRQKVGRAKCFPRSDALKPWLFVGLGVYLLDIAWIVFSEGMLWPHLSPIALVAIVILGLFCLRYRNEFIGKIAFILTCALISGYLLTMVESHPGLPAEWKAIRATAIAVSVLISFAIIGRKPRAFLLRFWSALDMLTPVIVIIFTVFLYLFKPQFVLVPFESGFVYWALRFAVEKASLRYLGDRAHRSLNPKSPV